VTLRIAYSPDKEVLFQELVRRFNNSKAKSETGKRIVAVASSVEPEAMLSSAMRGEVDALCPDSSIWLAQLEFDWKAIHGSEASLVGDTTRFAVSPIVIAMWDDTARSMGYPDKAIGWMDLLKLAQTNPDFRWSHPSTSSASGLLATLAAFYAGAEKTRGLTVEDVTRESTLNYVTALEKTVRYYGEGERAVMQQVAEKGRNYLDAFVVQEQLLIQYNKEHSDKLVAIYPVEGATWADHPLVFLERADVTPEQRNAYRQFRELLLSAEAQSLVLASGYRPTDLSIPLDSVASPIKAALGVDASQPKTTLQIPGPTVIQVVRDVWQYAKRKTNVYLVADVSGSMQGEKLELARGALLTFLEMIKGDQERVGLIVFSSSEALVEPLAELGQNRAGLNTQIQGLSAGGDTALLDAVNLAYERLQQVGDTERINAIVVMTDGKENNSSIRLKDLTSKMRRENQSGVPVVVFCVAYGDDAEIDTLEQISSATGGQTRLGSTESIQELYRLLSTYF
jgi:Ca-activated chloride channel family protein